MTTTDYARRANVDRDETIDLRDTPPAPVPTPRTSRVVLRRVEPWSVLRLSALFYLCVCGVLLVAAVILWIGAWVTGVLGNVESFFRDAGFEGFRFAPLQVLRASTTIGLLIVVIGSVTNLLLAMLFNLMSDVVGGIRITFAEDVTPETRR